MRQKPTNESTPRQAAEKPPARHEDAVEQLRTTRLRLLAESPKLAPAARLRLEAEPLVRQGPGWSDYDLSVLTMRLGYKHRRSSSGAYLSAMEDRRRGKMGFPERFALRCALLEALPRNELRTDMLRALRKEPDFPGLLARTFHAVAKPHRAESLKRDLGYCIDYAQSAICSTLAREPGPSTAEQRFSIARNLAKALIDSFVSNAERFSKQPVFFRSQGDALRSISPQPGFRKFFAELKREPNITAWIEGRPNVARHGSLSVQDNRAINDLELSPYDSSRVKEFTLTARSGETLEVVSKRLGPIKSHSAELEFERSKQLFAQGIPTPEPIAVISDQGNTYFLWRKVESDPEIAINFPDEVAEQKLALVQRIRSHGFEHQDLEERNLLYTMTDGKPLVWVIDLERTRAL